MTIAPVEGSVAVITADLIASRGYSGAHRVELDRLLRQSFEVAVKTLPQDSYLPMSFSVVQGDEFQLVLKDVREAYRFVVCMRTLLATSALVPPPFFRASIGIGEISVAAGDFSYAMDGSAFHSARDGLVAMGKSPSGRLRLTTLITGNREQDAVFDLILMYQDLLEYRWTAAQREAVRWRMEGETYGVIGDKLGIALQNVRKRLRAACWDEFQLGMDYVKRVLSPVEG